MYNQGYRAAIKKPSKKKKKKKKKTNKTPKKKQANVFFFYLPENETYPKIKSFHFQN